MENSFTIKNKISDGKSRSFKTIKKLDKTLSNDKKKATYDAYEKFERFKHPNKLSLADYIIEFEELLYYLEKHEIKLPAVAVSQQ